MCALLTCLADTTPAQAQARERGAGPPRPGLNWLRLEGAEACASAAELALAVEARLGRGLFVSASEAELFVDGYVVRTATGYDVALGVSDAHGSVLGRRHLQVAGQDCEPVEAAVALVIAVTLNPNSALPSAGIALDPETAGRLDELFGAEPLEPVLSATAAAAPPPTAAAPDPEHEPAPAPAPTAPQPLGIELEAAAAGGFGQLPTAAFAGVAALVIDTQLPIALGFSLWPPLWKSADTSSGGARFLLWSASLEVCPARTRGALAFAICTGAEAGRLVVQPSGFLAANRPTRDLIAHLRVSATLNIALWGPLSLVLRLIGSVPVLQHDYAVRTADDQLVTCFACPSSLSDSSWVWGGSSENAS